MNFNAGAGTFGVVIACTAAVLGAVLLMVGLLRSSSRTRYRSFDTEGGASSQLPLSTLLGYRFVPFVLVGAILAVGAMQRALITHDFQVAYVAKNNSRETPLIYTISGMWASLEGSILLWGLILAGFVILVRWKFRGSINDPLFGWAMVVMLLTSAFFFGLMLGPANPFRTLVDFPANGRGANPLLRNHPLMAFHPPILYVGYVGFTVPFAFATGALITGRLGEGWLLATRRWTLIAWGALTVGIVLGAWWSYEVLGWGGYWGWDPVENASLLPWLTGTAFIHSVLIQERRGMLRVWNLSLVCATFALTILGTFLTRSGVLQSVHAFSDGGVGPYFLSFLAVVCVLTIGLIAWRGDSLRGPASIDAALSREGVFLANNVAFGAFAFVVLLGTIFPLVVEAWDGSRLTVGAPYFERMTRPIGLVLLFLMAVAPALPWRKASMETLRDRIQGPVAAGVAVVLICMAFGATGWVALLTFFLTAWAAGAAVRQILLAMRAARRIGRSPLWGFVGRANGGMVVHIGVILMAMAMAGNRAYLHAEELVLRPGEKAMVAGREFELVSIATTGTTTSAVVRHSGGRIDEPKVTRFDAAGTAVPTPSVFTGLLRDVYVTLQVVPERPGDPAVIGVAIQPLAVWLWIGGLLMGFGTLLSIVPGRRRRPTDPSTVSFNDTSSHGEGSGQ